MGIFLLLGLSYPLYTAVSFVNCSRRAHGVIIQKDLYDWLSVKQLRWHSSNNTLAAICLPSPIIWSFLLEQLQQEIQAPQSAWTAFLSSSQVQHLIAPRGTAMSDKEVMAVAETIQVLVVRPPICNRGHVYCTWKDSGNGVVRLSEPVQRSSLGICLAVRIWESEPNRDFFCGRLSVRRMLCWKRKLRGRVGGQVL